MSMPRTVSWWISEQLIILEYFQIDSDVMILLQPNVVKIITSGTN